MSDDESTQPVQAAPEPDLPPLPARVTSTQTLTFDFPNLLLGIGQDAHGFVAKQIREGESRQVEWTSTIDYSDEPVAEEPRFTVKACNHLPVGGGMVAVLNDLVDLPTIKLPASAPAASEYLALIGKPVLIAFQCRRDLNMSELRGKPAYVTRRTTIILL